jgi:5-methylcytosine-specific restriction endonuclease McrA
MHHSKVAGVLASSPASPASAASTYTKVKIPKALREQVWITHAGRVFETKCSVTWCKNHISVFDYQCGHNIPESKGGKTNIGNLVPICSRCNISMGNLFTIDQWNSEFAPREVREAVPAVESKNCLLASLERFRYKGPVITTGRNR